MDLSDEKSVATKMNVSCSKTNQKDDATDCNCIVPVTPNTVKETSDSEFQSPLTLTVVRKQLNRAHIHSQLDNSTPPTPNAILVDSFAFTTEEMAARASQSTKYLCEIRNTVSRQLHFRSSVHPYESISDQEIIESLHENLLQFILSKQIEEFLPSISKDSDDECKSPPSRICFNGISDITPGAPRKVKRLGQQRIVKLGLCKKLEF